MKIEQETGRGTHGLLLDAKDQWWVACPNSTDRVPLEKEPKHCPHCGEKLEND